MIPFARASDYQAESKISPDFVDWPFLSGIFGKLPERFREPVADRYRTSYRKTGQQSANQYAYGIGQTVKGKGYTLAASDFEISTAAKLAARTVSGMLDDTIGQTAEAFRAKLEKYAAGQGVTVPEKIELRGIIARMTDAAWWRRQFRRGAGRKVEGMARSIGLVKKGAGIYASDETVSRHEEQQRRNLAAMQNTIASKEAINTTTGEFYEQSFSLADLAALGVSNPSVRFAELMVRVRGMEAHALESSHVGLFITGTAPSRMHAVHKLTGKQNRLFDGTDPRETQQWIGRQWARIRAALARMGVKFYGVRVAEPHHDGTPHWHMLVFIKPGIDAGRAAVGRFMSVFRRFMLRGDWKAPKKAEIIAAGRAEGMTVKAATMAAAVAVTAAKVEQRRAEKNDTARLERACDFKRIEASKGSAAGYLVKYLSKNISGQRMGMDDEADKPATETAGRVLAWASCWGIRQFQVIGGPPVGVWRELRRIKQQPEQLELFEAWAATGSKEEERAPDWGKYIKAQGGVECRADERPVRVWKLQEPGRLTKYQDHAPARVAGVECVGVCTRSRNDIWTMSQGTEQKKDQGREEWQGRAVIGETPIERVGVAFVFAPQAPRTRVNNCTGRTKTPYQGLAQNMAALWATGQKEEVSKIFNEMRILKNVH